jgi:poly-D-alanine transfer protein DltD
MTGADVDGSRPPTSLIHLSAGLFALILFILGACLVIVAGRWRIRERLDALALVNRERTRRGEAIQLAVLRRDDLLLALGSSEFVVRMPNRVQDFFATYPTGFAVSPVGSRGSPLPQMIVNLASLGEAVRGRRVVLSLSSTWFLMEARRADSVNIAAHAVPLQTGDMLFNPELPLPLRERIARRVVRVPEMTGNQALLAAPLHCLATRCSFEPLLPALRPVWLLRSLALRAEDIARASVSSFRAPSPPARRATRIDWVRLEAASDSAWRARSSNNAFGIDGKTWSARESLLVAARASTDDRRFLQLLDRTVGWDDLTLLLATLHALGARPLVLNTPLKGPYFQFTGVSAAARRQFYERFDSVTAPFGFPARNFAAYDDDPMFLMEPGSHLSEKGWAVYDRVIDAFYHDSLR